MTRFYHIIRDNILSIADCCQLTVNHDYGVSTVVLLLLLSTPKCRDVQGSGGTSEGSSLASKRIDGSAARCSSFVSAACGCNT